MAFLFWLLWSIDLLLCALGILGKNFKDSFHASQGEPWLLFTLVGSTLGSLVLRVLLKKALWALALAALPLLLMLAIYLIEQE